MLGPPDPALWDEVINHCLNLHKVVMQLQGRAMGLMELQERALWLNLNILLTKEKKDPQDTLLSAQGLCEEKKRKDEALTLCLLRRVPPVMPPLHRQTFASASSHFQDS